MCRPDSGDFELLTPEQFDIYGIVINLSPTAMYRIRATLARFKQAGCLLAVTKQLGKIIIA